MSKAAKDAFAQKVDEKPVAACASREREPAAETGAVAGDRCAASEAIARGAASWQR